MRKPAVASHEKYLDVIRGWDSSPRDVEIGETLADLLAPMARYRRLREDGEWELVPYERAKELGLRNKRGVLETNASTATIMWTEKKHASAASCDLAASDWDKLVQRKEELPSGCSFIQTPVLALTWRLGMAATRSCLWRTSFRLLSHLGDL